MEDKMNMKVIGIGGMGINFVNFMITSKVKNVEYITGDIFESFRDQYRTADLFINTSCDEAQKEMELDEETYRNEDEDEDDYTKEYYVSPTGNQMLKGRCFI